MIRWLIGAVIVACAIPAIGVGAFYVHQNWSGAQLWTDARDQLRASGEPVSRADVPMRAIPAEQNLLAAPVIRDFLGTQTMTPSGLSAVLPAKRPVNSANVSVLDRFATWFQPEFEGSGDDAVRVISSALDPLEPALAEIAAAATRPYTVQRSTQVTRPDEHNPVLECLIRFSDVFAARAHVAIIRNNREIALRDVETIANLARHCGESSTLGGALALQLVADSLIDTISLGLETLIWTEADLVQIDLMLAEIDALAAYSRGLRGERPVFFGEVDSLNEKASNFFRFVIFSSRLTEWVSRNICDFLWHARPEGWTAADHARYAELTQRYLDWVIVESTVLPARAESIQREVRAIQRNQGWFFREPLTALTLPAVGNIARRAARTQARIDLARTAVAIERHILAFGQVPTTLTDLVPKFLPTIPLDVIGGRPLRYRPLDNGSVVIYSIGWNGRDNGGQASLGNAELDWIW